MSHTMEGDNFKGNAGYESESLECPLLWNGEDSIPCRPEQGSLACSKMRAVRIESIPETIT